MRIVWATLFCWLSISCGGGREDWARELDLSNELRSFDSRASSGEGQGGYVRRTVVIGERAEAPLNEAVGSEEDASRASRQTEEPGPFRNTYYNFPAERAPGSGAAIYDAGCRKIADVSQSFHDAVCVQGSGRIASGQTVSFARRDCECASVCPRTGQRICFEALDPARFPWGRGALGKPITPLWSVAVDTSVVPFHTRLFIPEAVGLPRQDGTPHDGCFAAEDRGLKVKGEHVDIFTGDPATTAVWNARLPSNRGVTVVMNAKECEG